MFIIGMMLIGLIVIVIIAFLFSELFLVRKLHINKVQNNRFTNERKRIFDFIDIPLIIFFIISNFKLHEFYPNEGISFLLSFTAVISLQTFFGGIEEWIKRKDEKSYYHNWLTSVTFLFMFVIVFYVKGNIRMKRLIYKDMNSLGFLYNRVYVHKKRLLMSSLFYYGINGTDKWMKQVMNHRE